MPLLYLAQLLFQAKLCFLLNNFSAVVVTAVTANAVGKLQLAALGALAEVGHRQFPDIGTSAVFPGFGAFSLGYRHRQHLLILN